MTLSTELPGLVERLRLIAHVRKLGSIRSRNRASDREGVGPACSEAANAIIAQAEALEVAREAFGAFSSTYVMHEATHRVEVDEWVLDKIRRALSRISALVGEG